MKFPAEGTKSQIFSKNKAKILNMMKKSHMILSLFFIILFFQSHVFGK